MKSTELQELTASEPLTLEQEFDMQKSWREDEDSNILFLLLYTVVNFMCTHEGYQAGLNFQLTSYWATNL